MSTPRWPRKNDPESIRARQDELRTRTEDGEVFWDDLQPFASATEALTGVAVVPVAVVGPLRIALAEYELTEPEGKVEERSRAQEDVFVPLANTEGGLAISLHRGARAVTESGEFRTYVLRDRMTRASAFLFESTGAAVAFAGWVGGSLYVSIDHPDGVRTTYSWLSLAIVRKGDTVRRGDVVASSGHGHPEIQEPHLHFGARIGDTDIDPMILLEGGDVRGLIRLAPIQGSRR